MADRLGDWPGAGEGTVPVAVLALATLGTLVLFLVTVGATRRRRTKPFL